MAAAMLVGLAACAAKGPPEQPGAPETPSPVPITANPSALPVGDTVPTGIVIGGKEMVLYFWGTPDDPYLDDAWRDRSTGEVDVRNPCAGGTGVPAYMGPDRSGQRLYSDLWLNVTQCTTPDGTLIEYGAVRADAARITSQDTGTTVQARFARWSIKPTITIFWLQRTGKPVPRNVELGVGRSSPLAMEHYPLITAYDANGKTIVDMRIRPPETEQKGG